MFINPKLIVDELNLSGIETVVDLGTGSGFYTLEIASRLSSSTGSVYSVDIQQNILKTLANNAVDLKLNNIHYIKGDIEEPNGTKLNDNIADIVIISNTLHSVTRRKDSIKEAMRIIHEGGHILIIDWKDSFKSMGPAKEFVLSEDACLRMCIDIGLSLDKVFNAGSHHYALYFRKNIHNNININN